VSTRVPNKIKKASRKLEKHADGLNKIVTVYPELMDSLTTTTHDTITIVEHTVDTSFIAVHDTSFVDKILYEFLSDDSTITIEKIRYVRNEIIKNVLKDTTYVYEDSVMHFTFMISDGKFFYKNTIKEINVAYVKSETTLNPNIIKQPAWKNYWFWVLILIIIILLSVLRSRG
tara:strand:+ start:30 stop:548 length:519 start_codon:yes stop_codon:yes gene_type:complete